MKPNTAKATKSVIMAAPRPGNQPKAERAATKTASTIAPNLAARAPMPAAASTTSITDSIYRQNSTGTYLFYTHTWTSVSSLTDTVACDNDNCNSSIASQMYVVLTFTNSFGGSQQARIQLAGGYGVPLPFSGLNDVFGWGYSFPNVPVSELISFTIVVLAAAGMGALAAKFGAIVLAVLVAALSAFGWLPGLSPAIITLLVAFAVLAFVAWLEQGR